VDIVEDIKKNIFPPTIFVKFSIGAPKNVEI
jgi:hypothetical protein